MFYITTQGRDGLCWWRYLLHTFWNPPLCSPAHTIHPHWLLATPGSAQQERGGQAVDVENNDRSCYRCNSSLAKTTTSSLGRLSLKLVWPVLTSITDGRMCYSSSQMKNVKMSIPYVTQSTTRNLFTLALKSLAPNRGHFRATVKYILTHSDALHPRSIDHLVARRSVRSLKDKER